MAQPKLKKPESYQNEFLERLKDIRYADIPDDEPELQAGVFYKGELAERYGFSKNVLNKYINRFYDQFQAIGYRKTDKILTKKQVELLFNLIGTP